MEIVDYLLARKKAGGGSDVTIEQLSVTENGTYSEEGKAYSPVVVNVPTPANSYQLKNLPTGTVSTIEDGTDLPMSSLKVGIEPVQDLHGYDHPWAGGAGKNKLNNVRTTTSINGITFTVNDDGSVFIAGGQTASDIAVLNLIANDERYYNLTDFGLNYNVDYSMNGCPSGGNTNSYRLIFRSGGSAANIVDSGSGANFNILSESSTLVWMPCIIISSGYTIPSGGLLFKPMIRLATETDATFEPYSNICPISGWTEANVTRAGKNLFDKNNVLNGYLQSNGIFKASNSGEKTIYCKVPKGTITMGKPVGTSVLRGILFDKLPSNNDSGYEVLQYESNAKQTFTTTKETYYVCYCYNNTGETNTWQSVLDSIQIELGSTATTYEPYTGQTYTIQFTDGDNPLTVYGGTLDVTTGELVVDRASVDMGDLTWSNLDNFNGIYRYRAMIENMKTKKIRSMAIVCSCYKTNISDQPYLDGTIYNMPSPNSFVVASSLYLSIIEFINSLSGQTVVYELAEPITYHLTPAQVRTLVGTNNIWADTGDIIEGKYFKEL